ncbi:hypothetical protein [Iodidimonas sp. SYSU 1G8]|uniref:hypothetical protein n=1 Tax=Iodidimonas sp. SYSU 1G8 TaxID=3133967 RepID=UPI0031FEB861
MAASLEGKLKATSDPDERYSLRRELREQYHVLGAAGAEEELLLEAVRLEPDNPLEWMSLASFYWLWTSEFPKAIRAGKKAALVAQQQDLMVINSYIQLAHIARDAKDYATLSTCLEAIMDYEYPVNAQDCRYERNFLRDVPAGAIDPDLRARYGTFMRRSGHLRDYRPHEAIMRFRPVAMLVGMGQGKDLDAELLARADAARHLVRDMDGVPEKIVGSDDVEGAILDLGKVIGEQLERIRSIIRGIEDDRISLGMDEAERLAFERFKPVKGRYFRRHGRDELTRYIASMRSGEFDDW